MLPDKTKMMNNKSNSESCIVVSKPLILEDIMIEILTWLPLKCLLNSARYVCKSWAPIISTSRFAEMHFHHASSKPSLYFENREEPCTSYFMDDVNGQFERTDDLVIPPITGNLIGTCDGIIVFYDASFSFGGFFVVNPILKCCIRLPPSPTSKVYPSGHSQLTLTHVPHTAIFKLFFLDIIPKIPSPSEHNILKFPSSEHVLYVLRIGIDNSWKEIARIEESFHCHCICRKPVYCGGNDLYLITMDGVIMIDVDKEIIVGQYPLPSPPHFSSIYLQFLRMGNHLSSIGPYCNDKRLQIYILDIDSGKWTLYHEMGPFHYVNTCGLDLITRYVTFRLWINDQIIFRVPNDRATALSEGPARIFFSYNVKTKELKKIEGIYKGFWEVWLHTNSLLSLPSTPMT